MKLKRLFRLTLGTAVLLLTSPCQQAHAQAVTTDPGMVANIAAQVADLSTEINELTTISGTVSGILNVQNDISKAMGAIGPEIDSIDGGAVGQLISTAQLGLSDYQSAKGAIAGLEASYTNLTTQPLNTMSILFGIEAIEQNAAAAITSTNPAVQNQIAQLNNVMQGNMTVPASTQVIETTLFSPDSSPTDATIAEVNSARRAVIQNAAINGMTEAADAQESETNTGQTAITSLSNGVSSATDVRGDIQANSTILLKLDEQVTAQNSILSSILYLQSSQAIGDQDVFGPAATSSVAQTTPAP